MIHDFRSAVMGRITLETPEQFAQWLAEGKQIDAERQMKKDAIEMARLIRLKKVKRPDQPRHSDAREAAAGALPGLKNPGLRVKSASGARGICASSS